jgi:hypothetical protein
VAERDLDSGPSTAAFVPDFSDADDTGKDSVPFVPDFDDTGSQPVPEPAVEPESVVVPVVVPGRYQYVKWWKLLLVFLAVWLAAAQLGLSLFYWWYHTVDKTAAAYTALVYVVACVVAGVILAMVRGRPMMSALALAVMSGPFASVAAAAPLYGHYYCERLAHCLGIIPY